jgi:hypothetical protein
MNRQDPVVADLVKHINRSAGQHKRYVSEGTESARRLAKLPEQTEEQAQNLKAWRASLIANGLLHRVDSSQLGQRDGVSVGGCCTSESRDPDPRIEYAGDEPYSATSLALTVAIVAGLGLLVWNISPELRALVSIITY